VLAVAGSLPCVTVRRVGWCLRLSWHMCCAVARQAACWRCSLSPQLRRLPLPGRDLGDCVPGAQGPAHALVPQRRARRRSASLLCHRSVLRPRSHTCAHAVVAFDVTNKQSLAAVDQATTLFRETDNLGDTPAIPVLLLGTKVRACVLASVPSARVTAGQGDAPRHVIKQAELDQYSLSCGYKDAKIVTSRCVCAGPGLAVLLHAFTRSGPQIRPVCG
jgi:hypothetical protein